jgi:hypothetical protein
MSAADSSENGFRKAVATPPDLYRLLRERGCQSSYDAVRRYVIRRIGSRKKPGQGIGEVQPPAPRLPTARQFSFDFIRSPS